MFEVKYLEDRGEGILMLAFISLFSTLDCLVSGPQ